MICGKINEDKYVNANMRQERENAHTRLKAAVPAKKYVIKEKVGDKEESAFDEVKYYVSKCQNVLTLECDSGNKQT